jgi:hypothetical protein
LHASHVQVLCSKQLTCIFTGKKPLHHPGQQPTNEKHKKKWQEQADNYAKFMLIAFQPDAGYRITKIKKRNGSVATNIKVDVSNLNWENYCRWEENSKVTSWIEWMRITTAYSVCECLTTNRKMLAMMSTWHARNRTKWTEEERKHFQNDDYFDGKTTKADEARRLIDKFQADNDCLAMSTADVKNANKSINFAHTQAEFLNSIMPAVKKKMPDHITEHSVNFNSDIDVFSIHQQLLNGEILSKTSGETQLPQKRKKSRQKEQSTIELGHDQKFVIEYFQRYFHKAQGKENLKLLILGPPGTGKSITMNEVSKIAEKEGHVLKTSWNGIAAAIVKGGTLASIFKINTDEKANTPIHDLNEKELLELVTRIKQKEIVLIIIDEVSTMTPRVLVTIDARLRQATGIDAPFGGIPIIMCGDFMQIPPVNGMTLCRCALYVTYYNKYNKVPQACAKTHKKEHFVPNSILQRAAALFSDAILLHLNEQMRCSDLLHTKLIVKMSNGEKVTKEELAHYKFLSAQDIKNDDQWEFAPVLVTGNRERYTIVASQALKFAKKFNRHLI